MTLKQTLVVTLVALGLSAGHSALSAERWINPLVKQLAMDKRGPFVKLSDGSLMIVERNSTMTTNDDGKSWSKPRRIYDRADVTAEGPGIPSNSAMLLKTRSGVLILVWMDKRFLNWDETAREPGEGAFGYFWAIRSLDEGKTWVDRQMILNGIGGHQSRDILQTRGGRIVVPVQFYLRKPGRNAVATYSSDDDGKTWKSSNIIDLGGNGHHDGAFEPVLEELKDGRLWMLIRTSWDRFWEAYSEDEGLSWRVIQPSKIEASSSPGYITRLASGRLALVWNRLYPEGQNTFPRRSGQYSVAEASWHREELSIAFSDDEGKTWSKPVVLAREKNAWLAYPYVFERVPGLLWITTGQGNLRLSAREADVLAK
jgi:hypothetical protein